MNRLMSEPANRFASEEVAKSWLRDLTKSYLASRGISVSASASSAQSASSGQMISSAELEKINENHHALLRKQIDLYAAYVGDRAKQDEKTLEASQQAKDLTALQSELDIWMSEHGGSVYAEGIKPIFNPLRARRYDSWWNWAKQSAIEYVQKGGDNAAVEMLKNRADKDLIVLLEYLASKQELKTDDLVNILKQQVNVDPKYKASVQFTGPKTTIEERGAIVYQEVPRPGHADSYAKFAVESGWIQIKSRDSKDPSQWSTDQSKNKLYQESLEELTAEGHSWSGKHVLMTGCGRGSIGAEMLKGLLEGGAQVLVTTSSYSRKTLDTFRKIYEEHGSKGSALVVVPFNQGSSQDVTSLVSFVVEELKWELDGIIPFGAISENGRSLVDLAKDDGKSELAHRMMLTNVMRLLGAVAGSKQARGILTRPAQVILPLSPNHGVFGWDGLYGESKIGLETLMNRWHSEEWSHSLSIVGAVIGYHFLSL